MLVILVAVLLVSSGLCGLQVAILDSRRNGVDNLAATFALTGILELGVMLLSLAGIVLMLILWAVSHFYVRVDTPPRLGTQPGKPADTAGDDPQQT
jgi:hypothetical protein